MIKILLKKIDKVLFIFGGFMSVRIRVMRIFLVISIFLGLDKKRLFSLSKKLLKVRIIMRKSFLRIHLLK
jgi:hypothetical protein